MTAREKKLASAIAVLVVGWGGWLLWGKYSAARDASRASRTQAEVALHDTKTREMMMKAALPTLDRYQQQSLPADPQVAKSVYRSFLIEKLRDADLDFEDVTLTQTRPRGDAYTTLGYTTTAEGDLAAVTKFLHSFYNAPLLHKLTTLKLLPKSGQQLQVTFAAEALIVNGTIRKTGLPAGDSGRLTAGDVDDYVSAIDGRNLFAQYTPPPPPKPKVEPKPVVKTPPKPKFDDAAHAYLTGVVQAGDRLQAWITVRTTGEVLRLYAGDSFEVGLLSGTIESVTPRQIVVKTDEESFVTSLGSHLRDGAPVFDDAAIN